MPYSLPCSRPLGLGGSVLSCPSLTLSRIFGTRSHLGWLKGEGGGRRGSTSSFSPSQRFVGSKSFLDQEILSARFSSQPFSSIHSFLLFFFRVVSLHDRLRSSRIFWGFEGRGEKPSQGGFGRTLGRWMLTLMVDVNMIDFVSSLSNLSLCPLPFCTRKETHTSYIPFFHGISKSRNEERE
ncbi:hypothetical protein IE53DRAFT_262717 [Violaceomyces palustris]|uniref:Uncharacterized protein n=1 Tax=Violaceomyces palustris TaxID=1673888 RepID=A0ACD0NMX1_9BASI|nr:hypothetical protein IE53DRAFT_262717 [Violaceomyces palustris]